MFRTTSPEHKEVNADACNELTKDGRRLGRLERNSGMKDSEDESAIDQTIKSLVKSHSDLTETGNIHDEVADTRRAGRYVNTLDHDSAAMMAESSLKHAAMDDSSAKLLSMQKAGCGGAKKGLMDSFSGRYSEALKEGEDGNDVYKDEIMGEGWGEGISSETVDTTEDRPDIGDTARQLRSSHASSESDQ